MVSTTAPTTTIVSSTAVGVAVAIVVAAVTATATTAHIWKPITGTFCTPKYLNDASRPTAAHVRRVYDAMEVHQLLHILPHAGAIGETLMQCPHRWPTRSNQQKHNMQKDIFKTVEHKMGTEDCKEKKPRYLRM